MPGLERRRLTGRPGIAHDADAWSPTNGLVSAGWMSKLAPQSFGWSDIATCEEIEDIDKGAVMADSPICPPSD